MNGKEVFTIKEKTPVPFSEFVTEYPVFSRVRNWEMERDS